MRTEGTGDETVRFLGREEDLEIREAVIGDAVIAQVDIFEIEIPVVELAVGVAGEQLVRYAGIGHDALGGNIAVERREPRLKFLPIVIANGLLERCRRGGVIAGAGLSQGAGRKAQAEQGAE